MLVTTVGIVSDYADNKTVAIISDNADNITIAIVSGCVADNEKKCTGPCGYQGYSYVWCWTEGGGWDYCDAECNTVVTTGGKSQSLLVDFY